MHTCTHTHAHAHTRTKDANATPTPSRSAYITTTTIPTRKKPICLTYTYYQSTHQSPKILSIAFLLQLLRGMGCYTSYWSGTFRENVGIIWMILLSRSDWDVSGIQKYIGRKRTVISSLLSTNSGTATTWQLPCPWPNNAWWRHQMETFSALLVICAGNSPITGEFPTQRPVKRSFDVLRLNKRLSKQSWGWWFETPSRSLWRHCNGLQLTSCY